MDSNILLPFVTQYNYHVRTRQTLYLDSTQRKVNEPKPLELNAEVEHIDIYQDDTWLASATDLVQAQDILMELATEAKLRSDKYFSQYKTLTMDQLHRLMFENGVRINCHQTVVRTLPAVNKLTAGIGYAVNDGAIEVYECELSSRVNNAFKSVPSSELQAVKQLDVVYTITQNRAYRSHEKPHMLIPVQDESDAPNEFSTYANALAYIVDHIGSSIVE